jgi:CubicO group peptidase (beta-lactamase class C family)
MREYFMTVFVVCLVSTVHCRGSPSSSPSPSSLVQLVDVGADWSEVDSVLSKAIPNGTFPGCVAIVGDARGYLYAKAFGDYTYGAVPPYQPKAYQGTNPLMQIETRFDMASCTKVMSTTSVVALLYQDGFLPLDTKVSSQQLLGPSFAQNGKQDITVLNCLLHNAGYPPDPNPNYWFPNFGCPETNSSHPEENFSCRAQIYNSLLSQTLENPVGAKYVYSDLSFLTLMWVSGKVVYDNADHYGITPRDLLPNCLVDVTGDAASAPALYQCYYEAFARKRVFEHLQLADTGFLPPASVWGQCAPAENDTVYEKRVIQGQVSDGNAYALGGIAGHAGLFSTATDAFTLAHTILFQQDSGKFLNATTVKLFRTEYNHSQSSRALGWNTNDPTVFDYGWGLSCHSLSAATFMHLGYTGTQICIDPVREVITILLTNRVYPTDKNIKIQDLRRMYNSAVVNVLNSFQDIRSIHHKDIREAYNVYANHPYEPVLAGGSRVIPFQYPLFKQCNVTWLSSICESGSMVSSAAMALHGHGISLSGSGEDVMPDNLWGELIDNGSMDSLPVGLVSVAPQHIKWVGDFDSATLERSELVQMLDTRNMVVLAQVQSGAGSTYALVIGYDTAVDHTDILYVNDPAFNADFYRRSSITQFVVFAVKK